MTAKHLLLAAALLTGGLALGYALWGHGGAAGGEAPGRQHGCRAHGRTQGAVLVRPHVSGHPL